MAFKKIVSLEAFLLVFVSNYCSSYVFPIFPNFRIWMGKKGNTFDVLTIKTRKKDSNWKNQRYDELHIFLIGFSIFCL
jgi:hypothetical protein